MFIRVNRSDPKTLKPHFLPQKKEKKKVIKVYFSSTCRYKLDFENNELGLEKMSHILCVWLFILKVCIFSLLKKIAAFCVFLFVNQSVASLILSVRQLYSENYQDSRFSCLQNNHTYNRKDLSKSP